MFNREIQRYVECRGGLDVLNLIEKKTLLEAKKEKAGVLAYRIKQAKLQILLVHPGGPHYKGTDAGYWTPPKGGIDDGENPLQAAKREFLEETGKKPPRKLEFLGIPKEYSNCQIFVGESDISTAGMKSNTFKLDGKRYPEIDKWKWFDIDDAAKYIDKRFSSLFSNLSAYFKRKKNGSALFESTGDLIKRIASGEFSNASEVENAIADSPRGATLLGSGFFGTVYKVGNKAVKVGREIDKCWLGFAKYAMKKKSPWVPQVDYAAELPKGGFVAVMETLSPVRGNFLEKIKDPDVLLYAMLKFAYLDVSTLAYILRIFKKKFPKYAPKMKGTEVVDSKYRSHPFIKTIIEVDKLPGCRNDMHADNIMMRGNQIVIIDPVIRTKEHSTHVKGILSRVKNEREEIARLFQKQQMGK